MNSCVTTANDDKPIIETDLFKLAAFFSWIGVIKPHNEFTFKCLLVILVQKSSFSMTNMKISGKILNIVRNGLRIIILIMKMSYTK